MGELSARVFLARSNEMTNKKYRRGTSKPKQQQHIGSPTICILKVQNYQYMSNNPWQDGKSIECVLQDYKRRLHAIT